MKVFTFAYTAFLILPDFRDFEELPDLHHGDPSTELDPMQMSWPAAFNPPIITHLKTEY